MKFDAAVQALVHTAWDWAEGGFASITNRLGLVREPDADPSMPFYGSPWGKEWVQALVDDDGVHRLELLVEETSPGRRGFSQSKLVSLGRKYRDKLDGYVKRVANVKGSPTFLGELGARGFPADEDAHVLALWPAENARLMLTMRNEGPDTPYWISIVVRPPSTNRAPTARPSSMSLRGPSIDVRFDAAIRAIHASRWDWSGASLGEDVDRVGIVPTPGTDPQRFEFAVESTSPPPGGFSDIEHETLDRDYCEKLETYVQRAERILGRPKFNDGLAHKNFPKDENAQFLALWPLKSARVMIMYRNEGPDSPFWISIVVRPR